MYPGMKEFFVAFDINGTLLKRLYKTHPRVRKLAQMEVFHDFHYDKYFVYKRPFLNVLIDFLGCHSAEYVMWTTARLKDADCLVRYLSSFGFDGLKKYYSRGDCSVLSAKDGNVRTKDLKIIAKDYAVDIKNCILVDDSIEKSVCTQNFVCCPEFFPEKKNDTGVFYICKYLDHFFGCKRNCIAKNLVWDL